MNIALWIFQVVVALHTVMGAVWKLSNSEQSVPSLGAIPHAVWIGLIGLELLCSVGLVVPAVHRPLVVLAPIAAACIAAEMVVFCGVHLASGEANHGPMIYWLVVAAVCAFQWHRRRPYSTKPLSFPAEREPTSSETSSPVSTARKMRALKKHG